MKRIINGKRYNTETAKELAGYSQYPCNDFNHYAETLYRTKSGNYFLAGEGNAASKYSRSCGQNSYSGSSAIIPLTKLEAFAWASDHNEIELIESEFADCFEDA